MKFPRLGTFVFALLRFFRRPIMCPQWVTDIRRARCYACPQYDRGQCQLCTCMIGFKTLMATESCPAKKPLWKQYSRLRPGI